QLVRRPGPGTGPVDGMADGGGEGLQVLDRHGSRAIPADLLDGVLRRLRARGGRRRSVADDEPRSECCRESDRDDRAEADARNAYELADFGFQHGFPAHEIELLLLKGVCWGRHSRE